MERRVPGPQSLMHSIRLVFGLISMLMGASVAVGFDRPWWTGSLLGALIAAVVVALEIGMRDFSFRRFSHATIGLLVGLLGAWLVTRVGFFQNRGSLELEEAGSVFELIIFLALGFLGMMLALRSNREEFSLLIPYVRFRQDGVQEQPVIVDPGILIDGRLPRIQATGFLPGSLVIPRFVVDELHLMASSPENAEAERGKRGLECLDQMRTSPKIDLQIHEDAAPAEAGTEAKLIALTSSLSGKILSADANLCKAAKVQGIPCLNLANLARALRPVLQAGDKVEVTLTKEGKDAGQAIGYLDDGTMIVVNDGKTAIGTTRIVTVSGAVKTSAGRLIFAGLD